MFLCGMLVVVVVQAMLARNVGEILEGLWVRPFDGPRLSAPSPHQPRRRPPFVPPGPPAHPGRRPGRGPLGLGQNELPGGLLGNGKGLKDGNSNTNEGNYPLSAFPRTGGPTKSSYLPNCSALHSKKRPCFELLFRPRDKSLSPRLNDSL